NGDGTPSDRNILKGEATFINRAALGDSAKYNALGFRAIEGANNGDNQLVLGGEGAEYDGCPAVLILNHFFDDVVDPAIPPDGLFFTSLVLTPCTENFVNQIPARITAQFLVFNEFEQRFSTSTPVDCWFFSLLSLIDTTDPSRSIFSAFVAGTVAGQRRIRGGNGGLDGISIETLLGGGVFGTSTDATNLHVQGERDPSDVITVVQ